jgi:hypothetical protein
VLAKDSVRVCALVLVEADALCAISMVFLRSCRAFINLSFSGGTFEFSVVTEAGRAKLVRL